MFQFHSSNPSGKEKDIYIIELETEINLTKNQLQEFVQKHSELEAINESLIKKDYTEIKKIEKEIENKYKNEINELKFFIEELKRENRNLFSSTPKKV